MQQTSPGPDHGPEIRHDRVVITEWRDPEDRNRASKKPKMIRGAVAGPVRVLCARIKGITEPHLQATERLLDDFEIGMLGAKPGRGVMFSASRPQGRPRLYMSEAALDRASSYRRAMDALGHTGRLVIRFFVLNEPQREKTDLQDFAALHRIKPDQAKTLLLEVLDKLVGFYDPEFDADDPFAPSAAVEVAAAA